MEQLKRAEKKKKNVIRPSRFLEEFRQMVKHHYERQDLKSCISAIFLITKEDEKSCDYLTVYVPCPPCWASVHHGVGAAPGLGCAGYQRETQEDHEGKEGKWSWKNGGWCPLSFSSYLVLPFIKWERRKKERKMMSKHRVGLNQAKTVLIQGKGWVTGTKTCICMWKKHK